MLLDIFSQSAMFRREKGRGHHGKENTKVVKLPTTQQQSKKQARISHCGPPADLNVAFTDICSGNLERMCRMLGSNSDAEGIGLQTNICYWTFWWTTVSEGFLLFFLNVLSWFSTFRGSRWCLKSWSKSLEQILTSWRMKAWHCRAHASCLNIAV